jgi:lysophospholipase L1-like esterase
VREGMRITLELFKQMNEICRQNGIEFVIAIIPTKEMVFSKYLEHNKNIPLSDVVDSLLANERLAREKMFTFFADSNIEYVDTLAGLTKAAERKIYTRLARDMHPNRDGYRVIAESVFEGLKQLKSMQAAAPAAH